MQIYIAEFQQKKSFHRTVKQHPKKQPHCFLLNTIYYAGNSLPLMLLSDSNVFE
jgi:hypothetical protein